MRMQLQKVFSLSRKRPANTNSVITKLRSNRVSVSADVPINKAATRTRKKRKPSLEAEELTAGRGRGHRHAIPRKNPDGTEIVKVVKGKRTD